MKKTLEAKTKLTKEGIKDFFDCKATSLMAIIATEIEAELEEAGREISKCKEPVEISVRVKTKKK